MIQRSFKNVYLKDTDHCSVWCQNQIFMIRNMAARNLFGAVSVDVKK